MGNSEVIETLSEVMLWRGIPEHIRSDNGPEFLARDLRQWLGNLGTGTLYIEPGSPWENGYCESFSVASRPVDLARSGHVRSRRKLPRRALTSMSSARRFLWTSIATSQKLTADTAATSA